MAQNFVGRVNDIFAVTEEPLAESHVFKPTPKFYDGLMIVNIALIGLGIAFSAFASAGIAMIIVGCLFLVCQLYSGYKVQRIVVISLVGLAGVSCLMMSGASYYAGVKAANEDAGKSAKTAFVVLEILTAIPYLAISTFCIRKLRQAGAMDSNSAPTIFIPPSDIPQQPNMPAYPVDVAQSDGNAVLQA